MANVFASIIMSLDGFIIKNGLCDELRIHMVLQLLGSGIKLLDPLNVEITVLEKTKVIDTPEVTHLYYSVSE